MKCFFVIAISNIEIPGDLGRGDKIIDTTFITNSPRTIDKYLTPGFEKAAGSLETDFIRRAPAVIYALEDRPDSTTPDEYTLEKILIVNAFLNALWHLKDNAVDTQLGFTIFEKDDKIIIHSNQHMVHLSKADGSRMTTTFSRDELKEARSIFNNHLGVGRFVSTGTSATLDHTNRIQRALYFTSAARANSDIGLKVSYYCSAIEALFASNPSELTHQLSERVASFLEDNPQKRSALYGDVKKAYSVRSIVVHGKSAKVSRRDQFVDAAVALDIMLRQVYFKIFTEPVAMTLIKLDDEEFNTHFLLRIFGASWKDLVDND